MKAVIERIGETSAAQSSRNRKLSGKNAPAGCCEGISSLSLLNVTRPRHMKHKTRLSSIGDLIRHYPVRKGGRKTI